MPYKFEYSIPKKRIPREYDKRVKLTEWEREQIKELYGIISQRKLAKMFGVSRRLIIFIGCPEKQTRNIQQRQDRGGSAIYYDKEKQTKAIRKHRRYKQMLKINGKLKDKTYTIKQRCLQCHEYFVSNNGNRKKCLTCSPKRNINKKVQNGIF